jgi:hypothetical protein
MKASRLVGNAQVSYALDRRCHSSRALARHARHTKLAWVRPCVPLENTQDYEPVIGARRPPRMLHVRRHAGNVLTTSNEIGIMMLQAARENGHK